MSYVSLINIGLMEEIIQILIFVGAMFIAVIGQNAKNKKKPSTASPQEVLEDIFPEITLQGEDKTMASSVPPPSTVRRKKAKAPAPNPPVHSVQVLSKPSKQEPKISINNRKEARRAFIYSEIFNRKYS